MPCLPCPALPPRDRSVPHEAHIVAIKLLCAEAPICLVLTQPKSNDNAIHCCIGDLRGARVGVPHVRTRASKQTQLQRPSPPSPDIAKEARPIQMVFEASSMRFKLKPGTATRGSPSRRKHVCMSCSGTDLRPRCLPTCPTRQVAVRPAYAPISHHSGLWPSACQSSPDDRRQRDSQRVKCTTADDSQVTRQMPSQARRGEMGTWRKRAQVRLALAHSHVEQVGSRILSGGAPTHAAAQLAMASSPQRRTGRSR